MKRSRQIFICRVLIALIAGGCVSSGVSPEESAELVRLQRVIAADPARLHAWDETGSTPLHRASEAGELSVVRFLLKSGADVNAKDGDGRTPLYRAAMEDQDAAAKLLLDAGAKADIFSAARLGLLDRVKELVDAHPGLVRARDACDFLEQPTALHQAAAGGRLEVVGFLLERGADPQIDSGFWGTPIQVADARGHRDVVKLMVARGVPIDVFDATGLGLIDRLRALLDEEPELAEALDRWGRTPLMRAVVDGRLDAVKLLVERGADVNDAGRNRLWLMDETPLELAASLERVEIVRYLIAKGASVQMHREDTTVSAGPLHEAAQAGSTEIVEMLLDAGVDIDANPGGYGTPLQYAIRGGHREAAELLVDRGANFGVMEAAWLGAKRLKPILDKNEMLARFVYEHPDPSHADHGFTPLHMAARAGQVDSAELLVRHGADVSAPSAKAGTPLHVAIEAGQVEVVEFLLANGVRTDGRDGDEQTPLHLAVEKDRLDIVERLLAAGASVEARNEKGATPLHEAVYDAGIPVIERLCDAGADVNAVDKNGRSVLARCWWRSRGGMPVARFLIARGAKVDITDACRLGLLDEIEKLLAADPKLITRRDESGDTPLFDAVEEGRLDVVKLLLARGADVNARNKNNETPLFCLEGPEALEIAEYLLAQGADVDAKADGGATPLFEVMRQRRSVFTSGGAHLYELFSGEAAATAAALLISKGASVNVRDQWGTTPLLIAGIAGDAELTRMLLARGADAGAADVDGYTPLHATEDMETAKLLIDAGADVNARNFEGRTPLYRAVSDRNTELVRLLLSKGARVRVRDRSDKDPLYLAVDADDAEIIKILVEYGADIERRDEYGDRPLHQAVCSGHWRAAKALLAAGAKIEPYRTLSEVLWDQWAQVTEPLLDRPLLFRGWEPIDLVHEAMSAPNDRMLKVLIDAGANVNIPDEDGNTPLHVAASEGKTAHAEMLILAGADMNARNRWGQTPLAAALALGYTRTAELLRLYGARE